MDISACLITLNGEENIPRLMESLKDCKDIWMGDGGSTDNMVELAKSLGANVYLRPENKATPTQEDIDLFTKTFGYLPKFTTQSSFLNAGETRNEVITHAKNDWIFFPDVDEIVTWDFPLIQKMTEQYDEIECNIIQKRDDKGNPLYFNRISKLFRKDKCKWVGRTHEVIVGGTKKIYTDKMTINHYKKESKQGKVYETLEYAVLKDGDARSMFYLAREYFYYKEYQKSLDMFERYMKVATWRPEIAHAWLFMAQCCWQIQKGDDSRKYCLNAIAVNPDFKEALLDMSEYTGEGQKQFWKRYGESATQENVIFKTI